MQNPKHTTTEAYKNYFKIERFVKFIILSFVALIVCSVIMSHSMGNLSFINWLELLSEKSNTTQIICGALAYIVIPLFLSFLIIYRRKNNQA